MLASSSLPDRRGAYEIRRSGLSLARMRVVRLGWYRYVEQGGPGTVTTCLGPLCRRYPRRSTCPKRL
jgi:hypothetical protein